MTTPAADFPDTLSAIPALACTPAHMTAEMTQAAQAVDSIAAMVGSTAVVVDNTVAAAADDYSSSI